MTMQASMHTDLALELQEDLEQKNEREEKGYEVTERLHGNGQIRETRIRITSVCAARKLQKPVGNYITLEGINLPENDEEFHREMSRQIALHLRKLLGDAGHILIAGLGNRDVTPDALGPLVTEQLLVTRPWKMEEDLQNQKFHQEMCVSTAIAPGVFAQTGMETEEILSAVVNKVRPDRMIVIDALAARSLDRLNRTVQICDTGIAPGAGVGNRRREITEATMGVPVIAIGVPTVISIPALAGEIAQELLQVLPAEERKDYEKRYQQGGRYALLASLLDKRLFDYFFTPKEIDTSVQRISHTIAEGINLVISEKKG